MTRFTAALVVLAALVPLPAPLSGAQQGRGLSPASGLGDDGAGARRYEGSRGELRVETPFVEEPGMRVDGRLDEAAWGRAALLTGFTQYEPVEGVPATQRTEVLVLVGRDAVYFGVRAYDTDPEGIRATLAERDKLERSDDYVRITLDTFHDRRRAYVFMVNPLGVQQDGIWVEGRTGRRRRFGPPIDYNPDFLWESEGRVEGWGYAVEVRIPFKSLRFPDLPVQSWGLQVVRQIQRFGYRESWAPLSRNAVNQLAQEGSLENLRELDPGLFLEVNPVLTGTRTGRRDAGTGAYLREDPRAEFGLNLAYGLTSNLTLDATYNPDFSQVEADAGQIAVNERFALFFPEKRPFFLEGTEIFSLPMQLVYTRSVVDPLAGAKVTGKVGGLNLGYLGAVDRGSRAGGGGRDAVVNLVRLRGDVGGSSTVGLVYTDRTVSGEGYNRVLGVDGRLVFSRRYSVDVLASGSLTRDPGEARLAGGLLYLALNRSGRDLSANVALEDVSPDFRAASGFIRRVGDAQLRSRVSYNRYGRPRALVERWGPTVEWEGTWDHGALWRGGGPKEGELRLGGSISFRNNVTFFATYTRGFFAYGPERYRGLHALGPGGEAAPFAPDEALFSRLDGVRLFLWMNSWEAFRGRLRLEWKEVPIFDRALGVPVEPADAYTVDGSFTLLPTHHLRAEIGLRHESLYREGTGTRFSIATIPRIRLQYQFTRALFLRTIAEYSRQERGALRDPASGAPLALCFGESCTERAGSVDNDIHVEALLTYEPSPGTVMFIGYSRDMTDGRAFRFDGVRPQADGLFAKVSYRLRF